MFRAEDVSVIGDNMADTVSELEKIKNTAIEDDTEGHDFHYDERLCYRRQAVVSLGTFMLTLGAGATAGFSAVLIPQLQEAQGENKYSVEMVSWVAAMSSFALLFGNLMSGYFMEKFGRRKTQIILSIPFVSGWVLIGIVRNIYLILVGRFITGLCQGWLGPLGPVFVGEISSPVNRGFFLAALSLAIAIGVLLSHLFGTLFHWNTASLLCGLFPLIGCVIIYFSPESPAWLASKNRIDECVESFYWYRSVSPAVKTELDKIISEQTKKDRTKGKIETLSTNIKKPEFYKPLCIMTIFFIITQLSGVSVICAYTTDVMKGLIGTDTNKYVAMLSIDVLRCASLAIACVLLKRIDRRPVALFSGTLTSLSLIALAVYMYLVKNQILKSLCPYISLGLMTIYIIVSNFGIIPLPWNMVGELFATETKGIGSGISVMMTSISFFGTVKTAPAMFEVMGFHGTYLFYGLCTSFGTIFLYCFLPETKDKTLLQIVEYFRHRENNKI